MVIHLSNYSNTTTTSFISIDLSIVFVNDSKLPMGRYHEKTVDMRIMT